MAWLPLLFGFIAVATRPRWSTLWVSLAAIAMFLHGLGVFIAMTQGVQIEVALGHATALTIFNALIFVLVGALIIWLRGGSSNKSKKRDAEIDAELAKMRKEAALREGSPPSSSDRSPM